MEINAQVNTFTGGMNLDTDINYIGKDQYRYAENVRIVTDGSGTTGVLQNIEKNKQYKLSIKESSKLIATAVTKWFNKDKKQAEDCAVLITQNGDVNEVYIVTGFDEDDLVQRLIVRVRFNLHGNISIVTNYESQYVSNVYFTDGNSLIKVINIQKDYPDSIHKDTAFDIIPDSVLSPFEFDSFCIGALPAGQVQYAYKLFNKHGVETSLSPLGKRIPLSKHFVETDSQKVKGQKIGENTGLGCVLKTKFISNLEFEYIRIYRIFYSQNNQIPEVSIIDELAIDGTDLTYSDNGNQPLSVLSADEINALIPYQFKAKTLESMNNRLFAANIENDDWDTEYDARAYRCDKNTNIKLVSNKGNDIIGKLGRDGNIYDENGEVITVPNDHDCINPYNLEIYKTGDNEFEYTYDNQYGVMVKGGIGPNVSYKFIYTELIQSDTFSANIVRDLYMRATARHINIKTYYEHGAEAYSKYYGSIIPNYASAHICANYTGYRRDEIYRFGIVFYNQKMVPSPVHWIGDIRMPASQMANVKDYIKDKSFPFHIGTKSSVGVNTELNSYALGIEFTVNNIPEDAIGYEIVRCDRTEIDSTIVTQGAVSRLINFDDWGKKHNHVGDDVDTRPQLWLNVIDDQLRIHHRAGDENSEDYTKQELLNDYFEFVSPEVSLSKELMLPLIRNSKLCDLYWANSTYPNGVISDRDQNAYLFGFNIQPEMYVIWEVDNNTVIKQIDEYSEAFNIGVVSTKNVNGERQARYVDLGWGFRSDHPNQGFAAVFKYYNTRITKNTQSYDIDSAIIGNSLPALPPMELTNVKQHIQLIGTKKYINSSTGGDEQYANHGINCILQLKDDSFGKSCFSSSPYEELNEWFVTTRICNIKRDSVPYQGNTYSTRTNSVYISCGAYSRDNKVMCYGGDTYLNIFEYQNTTAVQCQNDVSKQRENRICTVCYIPLESSINLNLRHDTSYSRTIEHDGLAQNLIQTEITVFPNTYVQDEPLYLYNPAYSAQVNIANTVAKSLYAEDDLITSNRISCSEVKINNEIIDSWSKFKFANYLDVDTQYGQITNLKVFNNKLYYFQDQAVGIASVNERSLITDNNPGALVLGTGDILVRFDYLIEHNGDSIVNDKSIIDSNRALYWYDCDKNVICQLSQGFIELSKVKNVQSYLFDAKDKDRKKSMSIYDAKYNEIQFNVAGNTMVFNENLNVFTSFYTYAPDFALQFSDKLVSIRDNKMYLHNQGYTNQSYIEENLSKVKFVVNDNPMYTKVYDNQWFSADFIDDVTVVKYINTSTKNQKSEQLTGNKLDYREDTYRLAIPREQQSTDFINKNKSYAGRMRGKYLICDYTFDCSGDKEFRLPYVKTTYRYSMI